MKAALQYFREVQFELSKVTWPKKDEVVRLTIIVVSISAIIGMYVGLLDFIFVKMLELIISL